MILLFADLSHAFDDADRNDMLLAGVRGKLWMLLDDLLTNDFSRIHLGNFLSEPFQLHLGTAQGRRLSTDLFNGIMRTLYEYVAARSNGVGAWSSD